MPQRFDFWTAAKGNVVIQTQGATAVWPTEDGVIAIAQDGTAYYDDDVLLLIQPQHAQRLADAILKAASEITGTET